MATLMRSFLSCRSQLLARDFRKKMQVARMDIKDRVRSSTAEEINRQLDRELESRLRRFGDRDWSEIEIRIDQLEREWDIEQVLQTNASLLAFTGVVLGALHSKRWLMLPGLVLPFLFQHAVQGWCPPVPFFRRMGIRTRKEIDQENFALKALRGDFGDGELPESVEAALEAVRR